MININILLNNAEVYSIEYSGFFTLKFTVSNESLFSNEFTELKLDFVSGLELYSIEKNENELYKILDFYGTNVTHATLTTEKKIQLEFSNGNKILSLQDDSDMTDRDWILYSDDLNENYIINDGSEIYISESFKRIFNI